MSSISVPLTGRGGKEHLLRVIEQTGHEVLRGVGKSACNLAGIAVAAPGPFDYVKGISRMEHKHPGLYGINLRSHLAGCFGVELQNVIFLNDAYAFLLGEIDQAGLGSCRVAGFTLGTGIGSAFWDNGELHREDPRVPRGGEIWNLPWAGGTVEDLLSTRAISDTFRDATGRSLSVKEIAALAPDDAMAMRTLEDFGRNLGLITDAICARFQPDHIVLGGGIARSAALFLPAMRRAFSGSNPRLHVSTLFEVAALYGAAVFWRTQRANSALPTCTPRNLLDSNTC